MPANRRSPRPGKHATHCVERGPAGLDAVDIEPDEERRQRHQPDDVTEECALECIDRPPQRLDGVPFCIREFNENTNKNEMGVQ